MDSGWEAQQIVIQVARCADLLDIPAMAGHFGDTAVLEVGERRVEGRDAIFEYFGSGGPARSASSERTKHVISNSMISADGEDLLATSYFQVLRSWGLATWGRYEDRLTSSGGVWQIVHRKVVVDGNLPRPAPPPEPAASAASAG